MMNVIGSRNSSPKPAILKLSSLAVALVLIAILSVSPVLASATTVTTNVKVPIDLFVFVPCALGGQGELVELTGPLHILFVTVLNDQGGFHSKYHFQPQGVSGTGLTTGDKYQATGETQDTFNGKVGSIGYTDTFVNNFKIIGQGPGNNFLIHENFHVTVHPDGTVTAFVDNFSVICKSVSYP
jgi:hypothetical protein